jgi:cytochrome c oxidase subunit 2
MTLNLKNIFSIKWVIKTTLFLLAVESQFICLSELLSAPWQMYFQNPETSVMEGIIGFHDKAMSLATFIVSFVGYFLCRCVLDYKNKNDGRVSERFIHNTYLEVAWTVFPGLLLLNLSLPSFSLLYSMDDLPYSQGTLRCVGHQWYWSYEYSETFVYDELINPSFFARMDSIKTESYLVDSGFEKEFYRLLSVDNTAKIPEKTHVRLLVTSADVLHSWCIPSLGIKIDACPGRLNQASVYLSRVGVKHYGQCSELCGVNHGFMPIVLEAYSRSNF